MLKWAEQIYLSMFPTHNEHIVFIIESVDKSYLKSFNL